MLKNVGENLTYLQEIRDKRKLAPSFLRSLDRDEQRYTSFKEQAAKLQSSSLSKTEANDLEERVEALDINVSFRSDYFRFAPKTANGLIGVKAHTLNVTVPTPGYYVYCRLVGEKFEDNPEVEYFSQPSTPTPTDEWKYIRLGVYDCWAVYTRDSSKIGKENQCNVGDNHQLYSNCYVQIP